MGHFGASSAKPEKGWTNNPAFARLDQGKLDFKSFKASVKTVKKTISKSGKSSYSGTKDLKSTQSGTCAICYMQLYLCISTDVSSTSSCTHGDVTQPFPRSAKDLSSGVCRRYQRALPRTCDRRGRDALGRSQSFCPRSV